MTHIQIHTDNFFLPDFGKGLSVFMLVIIAELFVLVQMLALPEDINFSWTRLVMLSVFVQSIVLSSSVFLYIARPYLKKIPIFQSVIICLLGIQMITVFFLLLAQALQSPIHIQDDWKQIMRYMLAALIISVILLSYFYTQYKVNQQRNAIYSARMDSLLGNIRPHFLFNSMNSIASLIQINPAAAERAVEDLSDLFRGSLQNKDAVVPIEKEIQLSKSYLRIEQQRLGDRLEIRWEISKLIDDVFIPPFTLQPLIENAVYHGIQPSENGGCIIISISMDNQFVKISVKNPMPYKEIISKGNQLALNNIRSRLEILYGRNASLSTNMYVHLGCKWFAADVQYPRRWHNKNDNLITGTDY